MKNSLILIKKAIKNPYVTLKWIYINLRPNFLNLKPTNINYTDARIFFDIASKKNRKNINAVNSILKNSKCVFDIGSNCGYVSKEIISQGYSGQLVLFEPISNLLSLSVRLLSEYKNKKFFVNAALGDKDSELSLVLPNDNNIGWITAIKEKTKSQNIIEVTQEKTSKFITKFYPDFCKIDVEGYEYFILKEFIEFINKDYKPSFLVEIGFGNSNPYWKQFVNLLKQFFSKGYYFYSITDEIINLNIEDISNFEETVDIIITQENLDIV